MNDPRPCPCPRRPGAAVLAWVLIALLGAFGRPASAQQAETRDLRIGTSGSIAEPQRYVEKLSRDSGKDPSQFFAKTTAPANSEDALDDVVDKVVQAAVVDRVALEAYKRRKPGRFTQLNPAATSRQFPTTVIAYF